MAGAMLGNSGLARQLQASALGSPLESEVADDPIAGEGTKEIPDFDPTKLELAPAFKLTRFADLKGKGCRVPPALMESVLGGFSNENTRPSGEGEVGKVGVSMDCTITPIRLGGLSMISTTDMFYPVVEDPYMMGRIACSSILSDLYAMGVQEVDNMLMFLAVSSKMTEKERDKVMPLMIEGFKDTAKEAGTKISGGQTVLNPWLMIGGVATSICQQEEYIIPDTAVVGDVLVLTKPLGTGVALNCYQWLGSERWSRIKLDPSYVSASVEAGRWLDESKYEWGNMENGLLKDKEGMEYKLASAARKWRNGSVGAEGAFNGMRFILHMPENKKGPFSRLVKSGGGEVLSAKTPYSNTPGATHLLTETRYIGEGQIDFAGLATRGVPVMKPIYLNDFLTADQPPALEQHLLDEFKAHWESKKRSRVTTDTPTNAYKKTKSVFGNI